MLIGLVGLKKSGKTTIAEYIKSKHGFVNVSFATPVKRMLSTFLYESGVDKETIDRMLYGDLKETPTEVFHGKTPRKALQTLGNEWGRELIHPKIWQGIWEKRVNHLIDNGFSVVADDSRYRDEGDRVTRLGGFLVKVTGRFKNETVADEHVSERLAWLEHPNYVIDNSGDLEQTFKQVDLIISDIRNGLWGKDAAAG